jgi:phosphoenolpyruvate phosphomutase
MESGINRLKYILEKELTLIVPGIYDPLSAKLAEINGFNAVWVSGFCVSTSLFVPDENYMTIEQYSHRISDIRKITSIPLIVDCDEGYGNITNTFRLFDILSNIGVEACCIEDNLFPKTNSFKDAGSRTNRIEDEEKFAEKIYAIKRRFPELLIIARTESLIVGESHSKAIQRASAYKMAGADLLLIHSRSKKIQEFEAIVKSWHSPESLVVVPTAAQDICLQDLIELRFKIVILANQLLRNNINTMNSIYNKIRNNAGINDLNKDAVSMEFIFNLIDTHFTISENV